MKKNVIICIAALALMSCVKEVAEEPQALVFRMEFPSSEATKVAFDAGKMSWETGDIVRLGNGSSWVDITLASADIAPDGRSATITVTGLASADKYYAVYPAANCGSGMNVSGGNVEVTVPALQNEDNCFTCVASCASSDLLLSFRHPFALVSVTTGYSTVQSVTLRTAGGESLAGTVAVNPSTGECSWVSAGAPSVSTQLVNKKSYLDVIPLESFTGGLYLDVYDSGNALMGTVNKTGRKSLEKNTYYNLSTGTISGAAQALVNGTPYDSMSKALTAFNGSGGTLTFCHDYDYNITITCNDGVIDMAGNTLSSKFYLQNGGTLTVRNGICSSTGDCFDGKSGFNDGYAGTVVLEDMTVNGILWTDSHNYVINSGDYNKIRNMKFNSVDNSGTVTINGGRVKAFELYPYSGWSEGTYIISGGKFAFDPSAMASGFNVVIADGFSVQPNTDADSGTYPYKVASAPNYINLAFTEAAGEVCNPERGMMSYSKFTFTGLNTVDPASPKVPTDYTGESLAFVLFYLSYYIDKDLDDFAKNFIRSELDLVRSKNKKAVLRFAYSETFTTTDPQEAAPAQILAHLDQLESIFTDYADVIYLVQAGWLGTYGEWYYTTNSHGNSVTSYEDYYLYTVSGSTVTDLNDNHKNLLDKMLAKVPSPIQIALRTPFYKRYYLSPDAIGSWNEISSWGTDANQRIALFNDGLRGSDSDVGTFKSQTDRDMWYSQGNWLACGGEMSYRSETEFNALSADLKDCDQGIAEMRRQHISYLHYSTSNRFMAKWYAEGRFDDIKKALGYRLVLDSARFTSNSFESGASVKYSIGIANTGCAPVIYTRPFKLVLISGGSPTVLVDNLADIRTIASGGDATLLSGSFNLPFDVSTGDKLAIWLPDNAASLQANPAYSIRLASNEVAWENGYNVLYTF